MTTNVETSAEWTFVFTDIEESTKQGLNLSPAEYARVVEEHKARLQACFAQFGGDVEKNPGDGFFVAFPNVSNALACAVAIQQDLRGDTSAPIQAEIGGRAWTIQVRIGVYKAAGEVRRQADGGFTDTEVNLANRFASCGIGGQILINAAAYRAIARRELPYQWQAWDNRYIRDFDGPQILHELLWDETSRDMKAPLWAPNWLLRETNVFVGRKAYLDNIEQWLKGDRPLLVLHGEGGVGKTRLVSQAVRKVGSGFEGRIYGVALDQEFSGDPSSVTALQLAARIGERLDAPQDVLSSETPDALARYMRKRFGRETCWLILDNFESVHNEQTLELIGDLLYNVPNLRCMVTCRVMVELVGETIGVHVQGMATPHDTTDALDTLDSVRLFHTRANQYDPHPDLSDTPSLIRILNATEGNSLAIELIAAHCKNPRLTLKDIADGLEASRLKWLRPTKDSVRYGASRHKSLEACIDWSYQLLPPNEQELYPRLSVFPADFDPQSAETIAEIPTNILDHWIMFHLVQVEDRSKRCVLQPVLREFAALHLNEEQEELLHARFAVYYSAVANQNDNINNTMQRSAINAELRNLHTATAYLCTHVSQPDEAAENLYNLGNALLNTHFGIYQENVQQAIACFEALVRASSENGFPLQWAVAQDKLGEAYMNLPTGSRGANLQQAIKCYEAALRVTAEVDSPEWWAVIQNNLGRAYLNLPTGDKETNLLRAVRCFEAALRVRTEADFPQDWAQTQCDLGMAYSDLPAGDRTAYLQQAIACYTAVMRVHTENSAPYWWSLVQNNLGCAYAALPSDGGEQHLLYAIACFEAALHYITEADFPHAWANTQSNLGKAYYNLLTGDQVAHLQHAIDCYTAALRIFTDADFPQNWAGTQHSLALAYAELGDKINARQSMQNAAQGYYVVGLEQDAQKAEAMLQRTDWP